MKKVVGLGANVLDTLISCPTFPTEDTKSRADAIKLSGGGPVGNAMVVMAKLGTRAEIIGSFADDNAGRYLIDDYKRYGVETKNAVILDGESSFTSYIILSKESSSRTCLYDRGSVADEPDRIVLSALDDADILHLDGNYLTSTKGHMCDNISHGKRTGARSGNRCRLRIYGYTASAYACSILCCSGLAVIYARRGCGLLRSAVLSVCRS